MCLCVSAWVKHLLLRGVSVAERLISSVIQNLVTRRNATARGHSHDDTHVDTLRPMSLFVRTMNPTFALSQDRDSPTEGNSFNVMNFKSRIYCMESSFSLFRLQ